MKRVAVIAIFMAVMASLFAFPGYATTYNPMTYNRYTDAYTSNNVTYDLAVTQFKALSEGTSLLPGGMETIMFVTFMINNSNDQAALVQIPQFSIDLSDQRVITDVFSYGGDLILSLNSNGFMILPTEEFSYSQSSNIVVPPHSTLTCVGGIGLPAQLNQSGDSTLDTGLRGVHLLYKPYTVTLGDYSYGSPVDLSPVITYIDGLETSLNTTNNNLTTIINRLNNIITLCTYTGNQYSAGVDSALSYDTGTVDSTLTGVTTRIRRVITPSSYVTNDIEYDQSTDQYYQSGTRERYIYLQVSVVNNLSEYVRFNNYNQIAEAIPVGLYSYEIVSSYSDVFTGFSFMNSSDTDAGRRMRFDFTNLVGNYGYIPPNTTYTFSVIIRISFNDNQTLTFRNPSWRWIDNPRSAGTEIYAPRSIYSLLRDWYLSYRDINGLDDIDGTSDEITDKSEQAHTQEQSYFTQNAQAIQQTGLSNYRFNGDQENGIGSVSHDFTLLWNALGGFNSIYVFSLTLSLALMILRHAPGVIKSSRRNKEE